MVKEKTWLMVRNGKSEDMVDDEKWKGMLESMKQKLMANKLIHFKYLQWLFDMPAIMTSYGMLASS